ncbi:MAG: hypothetical protein IPF53_19770 [Blastocatellia bacterium]|jgi:hypothetical protein|nr:hypothetical protein [Blastocatellia bacterium]MBK6425462.1 hypothetical protein [Blastocatellia bacterium]
MNAKILGGVLFGALAMTGCGGDAGTTTNAAKNVATNAATNAGKTAVNAVTNVATNAGMPGGTVGGLPADFPKDIPVYTGATVIAGATGAMGKGATFSTADDAAKVAEYYKAELAKQGWSDVKSVAAGPATSVTASKDKRIVAVGITKGPDNRTMISVGESAKP